MMPRIIKHAPGYWWPVVLAAITLRAEEPRAQRASDHPVALKQAVETTVEQNPTLQAARVKVEEAKARLRQAGLWPNPEVEVEWLSDRTFSDEGEKSMGAFISQPFTVSGRIRAEKEVARLAVAITALEAADQERNVVGEVRKTFTEILATGQQIELQAFLIDLNRQLLTATRSALERGQVSAKDVNAVRIEWQQAQQRLRTLEARRRTQVLTLTQLMGLASTGHVSPVGTLTAEPPKGSGEVTLETALTRRPDYRAAELELALARAEQRVARAKRFEDWNVKVGYAQDDTVVDGAPPQGTDRFLSLGLAVPVPIFDRKQGLVQAAQAREHRLARLLESLRLRIAREVADARMRLDIFAELLASYQPDMLAKAEENVSLVEDGYRQGLVNITEVIQSRRQFAELKSSYVQTLRDYRLAAIDLETASGRFSGPVPSEASTRE